MTKKRAYRPSLDLERSPANKLLTVGQVLSLIPLSRTAWLAGVRAGRYPPCIKISSRSLFWRVQDIRELLARASRETRERA
jgi:prophage regulatory protein